MSERSPFDPSRVGLSGRASVLDEATKNLTEQIIGAGIEVHRELGPGFLESVYEQAMQVELDMRKLRFVAQAPINVRYKGRPVGESRLDLLVEETVVVELKAVDQLAPIHTAQLISSLRATGCRVGLLMNFGAPTLKEGLKRIVL